MGLLGALFVQIPPAHGADAKPAEPKTDSGVTAKVSYYHDIRPILQEKCQGCHQPAKKSGGYVMTPFSSLLKGGESGSIAVVPGKPAVSYLLKQISPENGKAEMPKNGEPLAARSEIRI